MPTGAPAFKTGANPAEFGLCRRSSVVEHPLRKRVVGGSNPSAGTIISIIENRLRTSASPLDGIRKMLADITQSTDLTRSL